MPAPIIEGLIDLLGKSSNLNAPIWDGETPRYDASGNPITPQSTAPGLWPSVHVAMEEPGFSREYTTEDPYDDTGMVKFYVWGLTRAQVKPVWNKIEEILGAYTNLKLIDLPTDQGGTFNVGGTNINPCYVIKMFLRSWWLGQSLAPIRTGKSELVYLGTLTYEVQLHGAIAST